MVTARVTECLRVSSELANKLDDLVVGPGQFLFKTDWEWMLAGQWAINASLHTSLLTLFGDDLPAGAFSLLRPISETLVRTHLLAMGDDKSIEEMRTDKFRTKFFEHPEKVDDYFQLGGEFKRLYDLIMNFLHSATHGGMAQMKRQLKGNTIEPNYPENEIIAVVDMSTFTKLMISSRVVERFRTDAELKLVIEVFREFTSRRLT